MNPGSRLLRARKLNGFTTRKAFVTHLQKACRNISYKRLGQLERNEVEPTVREINILCEELGMSADWWLRDYEYPVDALLRKVERLEFEKRRQAFLFLDAL